MLRLTLFLCIHIPLIQLVLGKDKEWNMKVVTSIQGRLDGHKPEWNEEHQRFVSKWGNTFKEKYRNAMDSLNTASIEGVLMYPQAEGINYEEVKGPCERKNKMQYVVFFEIYYAQTNYSLAQYQDDFSIPSEYCPAISFDSAQCRPKNSKGELTKECLEYFGGENHPKIGPCVGAANKETDVRAPYEDNYWFSFPNSCVMKAREDKTPECRKKYPGGLCPHGKTPDGIDCTYGYKILGYIDLDELTEINKLIDSRTNKPYESYKDFCTDKDGKYKGIEFERKEKDGKFEYVQSIPFWKDPFSKTANTKRIKKLIELYEKKQSKSKKMMELPSIKKLRKKNPKCWENSKACFEHKFGCRRETLAQICTKCKSDEKGCEIPPNDAEFPTLVKATVSKPEDNKNSKKDEKGNKTEKPSNSASKHFSSFVYVLGVVFYRIMQ